VGLEVKMPRISISPLGFAMIQYAEADLGMRVRRNDGEVVIVLSDAAQFEALLLADNRIAHEVRERGVEAAR
jgi:hypothetical protein